MAKGVKGERGGAFTYLKQNKKQKKGIRILTSYGHPRIARYIGHGLTAGRVHLRRTRVERIRADGCGGRLMIERGHGGGRGRGISGGSVLMVQRVVDH